MRLFVSVLSNLNLRDNGKTRIALNNLDVESFSALLSISGGFDFIKQISETPEFREDIYAVAAKRKTLDVFRENLTSGLSEANWQSFFEENTWIFGHGLNYVFLDKVASKLETRTTGSTFDTSGKRTDALLRTLAEVSQFVLVEIKRCDTLLLQNTPYRSGCWSVSHELSDAITQIQKTVFEFSQTRFRERLKDEVGADLNQEVYAIEPRSYLIVGNLRDLLGNNDKVTCFELYRRNLRSPEVLTFDELYQRARCIVDNISRTEVRK